ncbi:MAG: hypothetical protein JW795_21250 [Chitinivibrionales bacterium]|nr:hypothetical protein [Chitinivibrionales bacterium]
MPYARTRWNVPYIVFLLLIPGSVFSFSTDGFIVPVRFDGATVSYFNMEYPYNSTAQYSLIFGDAFDPHPYQRLYGSLDHRLRNQQVVSAIRMYDSSTITASAITGSEIGEILLNALENSPIPTYYNRDHFSHFISSWYMPQAPLNLYMTYRYTDNYSDRFDALWERYRQETGNMMTDVLDGLHEEYCGGYTFGTTDFATGIKTATIHHWAATPFFFSPLLIAGYTLAPTLCYSFSDSRLFIDLEFSSLKYYYNHIGFTEYTDQGWDVSWQSRHGSGLGVSLSHTKKILQSPASALECLVEDTISETASWFVQSKLYGNFQPAASAGMHYRLFPHYAISLQTSWDYTPAEQNYTFFENKSIVEYYNLQFRSSKLHTALSFNDTIFFPTNVRLWLDYDSKPLWESIEWTSDRIIIRQTCDIPGVSHVTVGGTISYSMTLKAATLVVWGGGVYTPNRLTRFNVPRNIGADFTLGATDDASAKIVLHLETRDRVSMKYFHVTDSGYIENTAPAQTFMTGRVQIPFLMPWLYRRTVTSVEIEAGPLFLSRTQRFIQHPWGNGIGPMVAIRINGKLR